MRHKVNSLRSGINKNQLILGQAPRVLFKSIYVAPGPFSGVPVGTPWDISPDGKRFLMLKEATSPGKPVETPRKINIVVNWFEELKQRVPMK
jgi:hypothetical protein